MWFYFSPKTLGRNWIIFWANSELIPTISPPKFSSLFTSQVVVGVVAGNEEQVNFEVQKLIMTPRTGQPCPILEKVVVVSKFQAMAGIPFHFHLKSQDSPTPQIPNWQVKGLSPVEKYHRVLWKENRIPHVYIDRQICLSSYHRPEWSWSNKPAVASYQKSFQNIILVSDYNKNVSYFSKYSKGSRWVLLLMTFLLPLKKIKSFLSTFTIPCIILQPFIMYPVY